MKITLPAAAILSALLLQLSPSAQADYVYADNLSTELPPPRDGVDTSLYTGVWLLKFNDVGTYERYSTDGKRTELEVKTTGWVYDRISPTDVEDDSGNVISEDHSKPKYLSLSCLPFNELDGTATEPESWDGNQYTTTNQYYKPIAKESKATGSLTVIAKGDGTLTAKGEYSQHPAGFTGRYNADNFIGHRLTIEGVKISDTASLRDNPDFDSDFYSCAGFMQKETSEEGNLPTISTELLGFSLRDNQSISVAPYFDNYDFQVTIKTQGLTSSSENTSSLIFK
ncbi:hypothetical protein [Thalassolituus oleivorans]|uniref:hypothetical protein n=1 Tax=Thalassolituus oleivorans TaxID=187493 RepID=UPI0023F162CB|nr:hypothetical protein [Thalassolituus oleivorans]